MIQAPLALKATDTFSSKSVRNFSRYFVQKQTDERHRSRDLGEDECAVHACRLVSAATCRGAALPPRWNNLNCIRQAAAPWKWEF